MTPRAWLPDVVSGRWLRLCAIALFGACIALACARRSGEDAQQTPSRRIIVVGGTVTEIVFALGQGDRVVAVDTSSLYPPEATQLPKIGYQRTLSAEGILALSPDLVIASAEAGPPAAIEQLRSAGIEVAIIAPADTAAQAAARIEAVGATLKVGPAATALAARVRDEIARARERCCSTASHAPKAVLVYARGAGNLMVGGADTPAAAMLELAGAHNVAASFTGYKPLSAETLVQAAPDVIVIPERGLVSIGGVEGLLALPGVRETPAGRAARIVAMDDLLLLGFGPRLGGAIDELARRMSAIGGS